MLGWEYPPHITGGLGTACEGLTMALARGGVDISFVVPALLGGERAPHMTLIDSWDEQSVPARSGVRAASNISSHVKTLFGCYAREEEVENRLLLGEIESELEDEEGESAEGAIPKKSPKGSRYGGNMME